MDKAFDSERPSDHMHGAVKRKHKEIEDREQASRHKQWLQVVKGRRGVAGNGFRPKKLYRQSAKRWCSNLDLQFRTTNNLPGLKVLKMDMEKDCWKDPLKWPHAMIGMDLGSDGLSGYFYLERAQGLNLDICPDLSHGGQSRRRPGSP